jgi:hypothetical protein
MIDEDDPKAPAGARTDAGTATSGRTEPATPPSFAVDDVHESEMTSVMGAEERRRLLQAARHGQEGILHQAKETARAEDFARATVRPPSLGDGGPAPSVIPPAAAPPVVEPPPKSGETAPLVSHEETKPADASAGRTRDRQDKRASSPGSAQPTPSRNGWWTVGAFILLAVAAWFAARQ